MKSIIIVGSGVAGTTLARQLLSSSTDYQITLLEAGPDFTIGNRRIWLDFLMAEKNPYETFIEDQRDEHERFGLRGSRLFVKGGTTNHWGGETPRFKPEDFELKSRTGYGADWPISYNELSPYYAKAEANLGIAGDSDNNDPPRHGLKYPFPPMPFTLNNTTIINALKSLGMSYKHMPMARNANRCVTTGTCDYCLFNARYTATFDLMMLQNEYADRLDLRMESPVTKILMDRKKRARGVNFTNLKTGSHESMDADAVIVCSGTFESTKLLLASANTNWVNGIGNDSGHVGRHLVGHPLVIVNGFKPENPEKMHQEFVSTPTLVSRHFDTPEYQDKGKMLFIMRDRSTVSLESKILSNWSRSKIDADLSSGMQLGLIGAMEQFESPENRISLGSGKTRHGLPTTKIEFGINKITQKAQQEYIAELTKVLRKAKCTEDSINSFSANPDGAHATSTCRMSHSDSDGVVDANLQVHNTDNLYVCSNAVFPNVAAANPTLTVTALAIRLADYLNSKDKING